MTIIFPHPILNHLKVVNNKIMSFVHTSVTNNLSNLIKFSLPKIDEEEVYKAIERITKALKEVTGSVVHSIRRRILFVILIL